MLCSFRFVAKAVSDFFVALQKPKAVKDYDEDDKEFLKKKKVIMLALTSPRSRAACLHFIG
jgi:hypothetical protein